jgi:hypothetical protein
VNHRLQLQVLGELAPLQTCLSAAELREVLADTVPADIHAIGAEFEGGVCGEQAGHLVPERHVGVVAVGALQVLDGARTFEPFDLESKPVEFDMAGAALTRGGSALGSQQRNQQQHRRGNRSVKMSQHVTALDPSCL